MYSEFLIMQSNFDQMLTFNCSSFYHFVKEVNEILYPGSVIITLPNKCQNVIDILYKMAE